MRLTAQEQQLLAGLSPADRARTEAQLKLRKQQDVQRFIE
jgi:hypothetical protein